MSKITLVYADEGDWVGFYKDGRLVEEAHSFDESEVLRLAGIEHETRRIDFAANNMGRCPPDLRDILL